MRFRTLSALLCALTLALAACSGDTDGGDGTEPPVDSGTDSGDSGAADADLSDDVAAVVNGQEVPAAGVEEQIVAFRNDPRIAEQLAGLDEDETRAVIGAQVVTNAIVTVLAVDAAEGLGVPVTDEDIAEARGQLEEQTGGADQLASAMEAEGMSEEQLENQLRALAALENIEERLNEGDAAGEGAAEEPQPDATGQSAQQFLAEQLAAADIVVNDAYGSWDNASGRVTPPGGMPELSAPQPDTPSS